MRVQFSCVLQLAAVAAGLRLGDEAAADATSQGKLSAMLQLQQQLAAAHTEIASLRAELARCQLGTGAGAGTTALSSALHTSRGQAAYGMMSKQQLSTMGAIDEAEKRLDESKKEFVDAFIDEVAKYKEEASRSKMEAERELQEDLKRMEEEAKKRSLVEAAKREEMVARMKQEEGQMGKLMEELGQLPKARCALRSVS
eukprot:TRINITY_DN26711_c0_g1_i2.p2 TRINITY_DN26711_c0_g1~~TRINITY_DN26711_c0_g1_i2.p2  ORF type:complete len:199 (-),score=73.58 TRINITY_DN26711_c0_g1_i2:112-708(-)